MPIPDAVLERLRRRVTARESGRALAPYAAATLFYFAAARLGLEVGTVGGRVSALYPASGVAIALLFLGGLRFWPCVLVGGIAANASTGLIAAAWIGVGGANTAEALIGAWLLGRVLDRRRPFEDVTEVVGFVAIAGGIAPAFAATLGATTLWANGILSGGGFAYHFAFWWLGDAAGALAVAPLLIVWSCGSKRITAGGLARSLGLVGASVVLAAAVFATRLGEVTGPYLLFPLVVGAALAGRRHVVVAMSAAVAAIAAWATGHGLGPIAVAESGDLLRALVLLDVFLATFALTGLVLTALASQRVRVEREVRRSLRAEREARAEIERASRRTVEILESVTDAFFTVDRDWRITYANRETLRLGRFTHEQALGSRLWEAVPELVGTAIERRYREAVVAQKPVHFEEYFAPFDSWFDIDAYPTADGLTVYFRDVTERRQLEQQFRQAQKMEALGRLAAGVAHDFNNLLLAVYGYGELALRRLAQGEEGAADDVREMLGAAQRAAGLTRQLLAFGRRQRLSPEVLDLGDIVRDIGGLLRHLTGENVELVISTPQEPVLVRIDKNQVEQVLTNLAVNSRDAMPDGGRLTLDLTFRTDSAAGTSSALLVVTDTGVGMNEETAARIFEPFYSTKGERGTGLGLSTVHGIVSQSGGRIDVRSEPGRGTTFTIVLPLTEAAPTPSVSSSPACAHGSETVLVVEDDPKAQAAVGVMLAEHGYNVVIAAGGEAALAAAACSADPVDLVLVDVVMQGIGGRRTADRIRRLRPEVKVLYMSGYASGGSDDGTSLPPGAAFIEKPFCGTELAQHVRDLLDLEAA